MLTRRTLNKICQNALEEALSTSVEGDQQPSFNFSKKTMIMKNEKDVREVYKISKKELGKGGFGAVFKCFHRELGFVRAVKIVPKSKIKNEEKFWQEINILI